MLGLSLVAAGAPAHAVPGVPSSVFDQDQVGWFATRNLSNAYFGLSVQNNKDEYLILDLEIDILDGDYFAGATWQRNTDGRGWRIHRNLTSAGFSDVWQQARRDGYRLTEQETYVMDGNRRYAGVWIKNVEGLGWASYRHLSGAAMVDAFNTQRAKGRMPIDIDMYMMGSRLTYSVVWVDNVEGLNWKMHWPRTSADYGDLFNEYREDYRLLAFDSVLTNSGQRYAGIWVENRNGRLWRATRGLTITGYWNHWNQFVDDYRLVSYDRYETAHGTRYAIIWREQDFF